MKVLLTFQNIQKFLTPINDTVKFFNTIHSFSQLILLPWGFESNPPDNYDKIFAFATEVSNPCWLHYY